MHNTPFDLLLKEFEPFFNCPLTADENNTCLIKMGLGLSLQLEMNIDGQFIIGCVLGTLPSNRYRNDIITEALKSNNAYPPSDGVLSFSHKTNHLILFILVDPQKLNQEWINSKVPVFIQRASIWSKAIENGEIPSIQYPTETTSGIFGLKS